MVKPSTLPVAGRAGGEEVLVEAPVGVEVLVVVVAAVPEFEHPARESVQASRAAAAKGAVLEVCIGSSYAAQVGRWGHGSLLDPGLNPRSRLETCVLRA
jgi:hypothetical protein